MSEITLEIVKKLRQKTGVGIQACKDALEKTNGDFDKAVEELRKRGILKSRKRAGRSATNGFIGSYVHNGQIGVLVELASETDFVSRNEKFRSLAKEIALHVAASAPLYLSKEDVPEEVVRKEKEILEDRLKDEGKPENMLEKISQGQLQKYYEEVCLLEQPYIRDDSKKIHDLIDEAVAAFGEKIVINRFVRIELGGEND